MPLEPGKSLVHYRIERLIGQGGMGAVYLVEDTRLHRKVALKVLRADLASHSGRLARFRREAHAVAALNHPNIVTIHSVEEAEGTHFLTMELVEGRSLDHLLPPDGLPLARVFDIGLALADALAAAHEKAIVHRDLKPANVMITRDGRVKVLDFGLAKLAPGTLEGMQAPGGPGTTQAVETARLERSLTATGVVVGTVPYMSPEQVSGEPVDARTDIFSLGVVLYEMTTGRRPFGGKNQAETVSSILRDAPRPLTEARQDAPRELVRIIDHCLQKDPRDRFQTARDVFNELRALRKEVETAPDPVAPVSVPGSRPWRRWTWAIGGIAAVAALGLILFRAQDRAPQRPAVSTDASDGEAEPDPKSIAVLPFVNMSEDKANEYFSDGVSEELLNLLSKMTQLKVSARTSSFSFRGKDVEIREIARQLNVAHVLEGSVRKSGDRVRITAQLIRAADGYHVWSQTWDRTLDDIFRIQDEIAADVGQTLQVTLLGAAPRARRTDPRAFALYLQIGQVWRQHPPAEAYVLADSLLRQVLSIDPNYTPAWFALGTNANNAANWGFVSPEQARIRLREAAERALAVDPGYAPAHGQLGWIAMNYDNDLAGAAQHYEHALALDPTDLNLLGDSSTLLLCLGRPDEALPLLEAVIRRDPVNSVWRNNLGFQQAVLGRMDAAVASLRTAVSLNPTRPGYHSGLGTLLVLKGDPAEALAEMELESSDALRLIGLSRVYHALGRAADSDRALEATIAKSEKDLAYQIACLYAIRGEKDQAFSWLDKAAEYRDPALAAIMIDWDFDEFHSDPRWLPFLQRIGRDPEQLARIRFNVTLPKEP